MDNFDRFQYSLWGLATIAGVAGGIYFGNKAYNAGLKYDNLIAKGAPTEQVDKIKDERSFNRLVTSACGLELAILGTAFFSRKKNSVNSQ